MLLLAQPTQELVSGLNLIFLALGLFVAEYAAIVALNDFQVFFAQGLSPFSELGENILCEFDVCAGDEIRVRFFAVRPFWAKPVHIVQAELAGDVAQIARLAVGAEPLVEEWA